MIVGCTAVYGKYIVSLLSLCNIKTSVLPYLLSVFAYMMLDSDAMAYITLFCANNKLDSVVVTNEIPSSSQTLDAGSNFIQKFQRHETTN